MSKEARNYRALRNSLLAAIILGIPTINFDTTKMVLKHLSGGVPDCSHGEAANPSRPYDLIAVFSAGTYVDGDGKIHPNTAQRERLQAAAKAYVERQADKILIIDAGDNNVAEASIEFIQQEVKQISHGNTELDRNSVDIADGSVNTATNARDLRTYSDLHGYKKILGITHASHAPRAEILSCDYGVNIKVEPVESFYPQPEYSITSQEAVDQERLSRLKEELETLSLVYDPLGFLQMAAKSGQNSLEQTATKTPYPIKPSK